MALARSVFTISFFISISRIFGFIRDILIAKFLGVSLLSDAFFAAFRLPNFFRTIFAEGAFNSSFVPIFVEKLQDRKMSIVFARNVFSFLFYTLFIIVILFEIFMPQIVKILFPGFLNREGGFDLIIDLSRITMFYLLTISVISLCSAILNSLGKFAVPASSPIILNLSLILAFLLLKDYFPNYAYALSWGVFIAGILQALWLFIFTLKAKMLIYPSIPRFNQDTMRFLKKILPGIIGSNVMQLNLLVNTIIASFSFGAVSYLYYAERINQLPLAMIGIAIGIALLPSLSRHIKDKKFERAIKLQNTALEIGLILVIPATLALVTIAYPIVVTLFERGQFSANESFHVARALQLYSFGLPAYVLVKIMEPSFFSRGNTRTPMRIAIICFAVNLALNLLAFFVLNLSYVGIIISSVISSYLNLALLMIILLKKQHFYFEKDFSKKFIRIIIPALIMALVLIILRDFFAINDHFHIIIELIIIIFSGIATYVISSFISGSAKILLESGLLKKKR